MKFSNKLSLAILITGLIVLIISSFSIYKFNYNTVIKLQFMHTKSMAEKVADEIDHMLHEKVKTAMTLANTPLIKRALETSNFSYAKLSDEKRSESIKLLNEKWKSTKDPIDNFILKFIDNEVSHFLKSQQGLIKGEYGEIFLTNKFGALVASTSKLSTFAHGHKYWWLGCYNKGEGAVFFDDRGYDDSVGGYVLGLVVPIRNGTEIIGILKCNLNILGTISKLITGAEHKLLGKFKLTRSGGRVVFEDGFEPLSTQIHADIIKEIKRKNNEFFIFNDSRESHLVRFSEIELTKGQRGYGFGGTFESIDHKKGNTGESWYVLCYRQLSVAKAPITKSVRQSILISTALILVLVLVSFLFGRKITQPLAMLERATQKIGKGDFEYRIDQIQNDEFGNLANSFNHMANRLQQTTTTIERLQESEDFTRTILDNLPIGVAVNSVDPFVNFNYMNDNFPRFYRTTREALADPDAFWDTVYEEPEFREEIKKRVLDDCASGDPERMHWENVPITRKGEETVFLNARNTPVHSRKLMISTVWDVTKLKRSEKALQEREEKYRNIFENIQDVYYESSIDGTLIEISPSIENISGYKRKELIGKSLNDIYTNPEERNSLLKIVSDSGKATNYQVHLANKDGSKHTVELNVTLFRDQKGNPIKLVGSMRDISERKKLEERLRYAQKMEAIGSLAGGTAHDFNNILTTIIGNTEMALDDVPESNPARKCLEEIQIASLRAKDVVRQLLGFAQKSVFRLVPVQISTIISETLKLLRASIPTTIEIRKNLSCKSCIVMGDSTQISQVLMDLCTNSKNAMQEDGGVLEVSLQNVEFKMQNAELDLEPGHYAKLIVRDSGHGIDPKIIDRIFDPYFTTNSLAEATGMGLAAVHGIVKNHKGAITVASELGKGTVFEVLFPLTEDKTIQKAEEPEALTTGNENILFVDDEASLAKMVKRRLEMQGYRVETKGDPVEALKLILSKPDRFDLVITDMTMPNMTGDKLAREILSIRPDMPIILCSGFSEKINAEKAKKLGIREYMEKPLDMPAFLVSIRKVFDEAPS